MNEISEKRLKYLVHLHLNTTPGPWVGGVNKRGDENSLGPNYAHIALTAPGQGVYHDVTDPNKSGGSFPSADQAFIVASHHAWPDLIAEIRRLRQAIKKRNHCVDCGKLNPVDNVCEECWREMPE